MDITVYGAGYVGLVTALCLAKIGHRVCCMDKCQARIALLKKGHSPIFEKDIDLLLQQQLEKKQLFFTADLEEAVHFSTVHLIALGTPRLPDGSTDLTQLFDVIEYISHRVTQSCSIVIKSTVPVGTSNQIKHTIQKFLSEHSKKITISVGANPEFLREGTAINDFLNADRIVIGGDEQVTAILKNIYKPLSDLGIPLLTMDPCSAELTKYAANILLACKISFINKISELSHAFDADINQIARGISLDHRIGPHFLKAGIGYGGSCLSKDIHSLIQTSKSAGIDASFFEAIEQVNHHQKKWVMTQLNQYFKKQLTGLHIGIWGIAFKPGTDDIREASSLVTIHELSKAGVDLLIYDPKAIPNTKEMLGCYDNITWLEHCDEVFQYDIDALLLLTEWDEFVQYPLVQLKEHLQDTPLFDGRNCYNLDMMNKLQFNYYSVGRPAAVTATATAKVECI
ncbi:UDP-glucose dehydrogenase family protein [Legionella sp. WA2022007384]